MLNDKWKESPISVIRLTIILFYYYVIFSSYIPNFVYELQQKAGIYTNGTIRIEYQVIAYILGLVPIIILIWPLIKKEKKLDLKKIIITFMFLMILAIFMNSAFSLFISLINDGEFINSNNQNGLNELMQQNMILHHFMIIVLSPCLEELVFRGAIFRSLRAHSNFWISAFISSILFGLIHVSSSLILGNWLDFTYLILYAGLGLLFCCTYEYNKSVLACILMHMIYNACTLII